VALWQPQLGAVMWSPRVIALPQTFCLAVGSASLCPLFAEAVVRSARCLRVRAPMATATANRFSPAASKRGERRRGLHAARVEAVERLGATCALGCFAGGVHGWHVVAFGMMIRCHEMMVIGCAMLVCGVRP
jgi:hypothetical protein